MSSPPGDIVVSVVRFEMCCAERLTTEKHEFLRQRTVVLHQTKIMKTGTAGTPVQTATQVCAPFVVSL